MREMWNAECGMWNAAILALLAFGISWGVIAFGATPEPKDVAFGVIQNSYKAGRWEETVREVDAFRQKWPKSEREAAITIIGAEARLKLRDIEGCQIEAWRLLAKFSESGFTGRAHLCLGQASLIKGDWETARKELGWVVGFGTDTMTVRLAESHLKELDAYLKSVNRSKSIPASDTAKVTLLLPLSGTQKETAKEFLHGFLWRWRREGLADPSTYDTEGDPVRAVRLFQNASREEGASLVIGGLDRGEAAALAAASTDSKTTFLSTVASEPGLASIGPNVIQGRPDQRKVGEALAKYAIKDLQLRRFAIVAPVDLSLHQIAEGFREAVVEGGGEILSEAAYYPGLIDFAAPFKQIREAAVRRSFDDSLSYVYESSGALLLDDVSYLPSGADLQAVEAPTTTGMEFTGEYRLSRSFLDSLWQENYRRARRWMEATGKEIDSVLIPTPALDGVLIIIEPSLIEIVSPQLARYNLNKHLFGNDAWGDRDLLRRVARYVEGMVLADPLSAIGDTLTAEFSKAMIETGDKTVTRSHFAGERAASMAVIAALGGSKGVRDCLATLTNLPTLSGRVSLLREERVVRETPLFLITNGEPIPLTK